MSPVEKENYVVEFLPAKVKGIGEIISFIVKRTYEINEDEGKLEIANSQNPIVTEDELYNGDDPFKSSVKRESDMVPIKHGVDVVIQGKAIAPGGIPVPSFEVSAKIGNFLKKLKIYGNRKCIYQPPKKVDKKDPTKTEYRPPIFTDPEPISEVPLTYENAYGGKSYVVPLNPEIYDEIRRKAMERFGAKKEEKEEKEKENEKKTEEKNEAKDSGSGSGEAEVLKDEPENDDTAFTDEFTPPEDTSDGGTQILDISEIQEKLEEESKKEAGEYDEEGTRIIKGDQIEEVSDSDWEEELKVKREEPEKKEEKEEEEPPFDIIYCPSNPVGKGFAYGNFKETLDGLELPNIEDPDDPITPMNLVVFPEDLMNPRIPAGFSWYGKGWLPRSKYVGADPENIENIQDKLDDILLSKNPENEEERKEIEAMLNQKIPEFKTKFYNGAHPSMILPELYGNEEITLTNMSESGTIFFKLPGHHPFVTLDRGKGKEVVYTKLDTLYINTEEKVCELVWRGYLHYGGPDELAEYPKFDIDVEDMDIVEYRANSAVKKAKEGYDEEGVKILEMEEEDKQEALKDEEEILRGFQKPEKKDEKIPKDKDDSALLLRDDGENVLYDDEWIDEEKQKKFKELGMEEELKKLEEKQKKKKKKEELKKKIEELKLLEQQKKKKDK